MKLLDYTGLTRLTANIKSYIASKLQPIDERTPFYSPALILNNGGYFDTALSNSIFTSTEEWTRIDGTSTGEAKAMLDRFTKGGTPTVIYVDYVFYRIPFVLVSKNTSSVGQSVTAIYRCPWGLGAKVNQIEVRNVRNTYLLVKQSLYEEPAEIDRSVLPFHAIMYSVAADGTVFSLDSVSTGWKTLTSSSTGYELEFYNRIQQGLPPAIRVDKTMEDNTKRAVWLYLDSIGDASGGVLYKSREFPDPANSGKMYLSLGMAPGSSSVKVNLSRVAVS